jgi:hypothetical protein
LKRRTGISFTGGIGLAATASLALLSARQQPMQAQGKATSAHDSAPILPLVQKYCLGCHSTQAKRGGLDLQRFRTPDAIRRDAQPWQGVIEHLDVGDMPPPGSPQPTANEKQRLIGAVRALLAAEAAAQAGDPGAVPLRRLSNAEYDATVRDLTGVDLRPTREFPADGAAGEGFTNAAEALTDISPELLTKYFDAAKEIAAHAQLLPDGIRFAPTKTRRDWTDESTARLRAFYAACAEADRLEPDGKLQIQPYLTALVRQRDALTSGKITPEAVAAQEKLNAKYLTVLWTTLTDATPSYPLDVIRTHWRQAGEKDVPALAAEVSAWQGALWQAVRVGSYIHPVGKGYAESVTRQVAVDPSPAETRALRGAAATPEQSQSAPDAKLLAGYADFRRCFPLFVCFPPVIPNDEVVSLKMFHREDEPLCRLFLDAEQTRRLNRLWTEHRFLSRQPAAENTYLPLFIGFVSQDQPKEMLAWFEGQRPVFKARADAFEQEEQAAIPKQMEALLDFASRAYRRPLTAQEKSELMGLYQAIRGKGAAHEEALRGVLARILVAPAFLFRVEKAPAGKAPGPVSDWELASRLSYFLWSSAPDAELRRLAAANRLHDSQVLSAQARRMIRDERVRSLAVEFGTQWINVRGFDALQEKNERLFPTFDSNLRQAIYEESILFFQDLFQSDRPVTQIIDRDDTFLNETLAKHYGIPGVSGPQWRRVTGVHRYGRGGVLGLASVQAKEAGASRTSPVLRGNWVVETLLGEKLPRPPANVPKLPEEEGTERLTMRQELQRHTQTPACAVCHRRIDPYGFALEHYDAIGRLRDKEVGGLPVDARVKLRDGAEFEGIDGLRAYLLTHKRQVIVRLFCRRLLGYALGRSVINADQPLIDRMVQELNRNGGRVADAVEAIIQSKQFRMIRGRDCVDSTVQPMQRASR